MALSYDLLSQFAKIVNPQPKTSTETTVYGTVHVDADGNKYVHLDGSPSELLTPISDSSVDVAQDERVSATIKDHTLTVTGNISSPAGRNTDVQSNTQAVTKIEQQTVILAEEVHTTTGVVEDLRVSNKAQINNLETATAKIAELEVSGKAVIKDLEAATGRIETLESNQITTEMLDADYAKIKDLDVVKGDITELESKKASIEQLEALDANVENLYAKKAEITNLDSKFVNINFANIDNAWFEEFFARSAIIKDLTIGDTTVTGELVGVTIKGDLIEGGTVKADKLVVKGTDGIYYKLNYEAGKIPTGEPVPDDSLHGSVITAKSITAEKVSVKDLVAFGATIGGFNITDRSLYSGVKSSADNSTRGIYFDTDAQFVVGDTNNFLRYIQVPSARVDISENSIVVDKLGDSTNVTTAITDGIFHLSSIVEPSVAASQVIDGVCKVFNNIYKLEISAESIVFGDGSRSSAADLKKLTEHVKVGYLTETSMCEVIFNAVSGEYTRGEVVIKNIIAQNITATPVDGAYTTSGDQVYDGDGTDYTYICFVQDKKPCVELAEGDSNFKQVITNTKTQFMDGATVKTTIDKDGINTDNLVVNNEFRQGGFVWASRPNGNYGLSWVKGVTS
jgi:uncharacterized protein YlxW (UPF0749 family)